MALGTVLEIDRLPTNVELISDAIDTRQKGRVVWQWSVIAVRDQRLVLGHLDASLSRARPSGGNN